MAELEVEKDNKVLQYIEFANNAGPKPRLIEEVPKTKFYNIEDQDLDRDDGSEGLGEEEVVHTKKQLLGIWMGKNTKRQWSVVQASSGEMVWK